MDFKDIIKRPIITEKLTRQSKKDGEGKWYGFVVDIKANKRQIKEAIQKIFKVEVKKVKTIIMKGKKRREFRLRREIQGRQWKKALIQLKDNQKIELLETGE